MRVVKKNTELIICESPPLFLGITALILKKIKSTKLLFNVSDLWPQTAEELGLIKNRFLLSMTKALEEYIYAKSDFLSGQTLGIVEDISGRMKKKYFWYKNGHDFKFKCKQSNIKWRKKNGYKNDDILILYAGILGHAQGLDSCLKAAKMLINNHRVHFLFFGAGPEENNLKKLKLKDSLNNVRFFGHFKKEELSFVFPNIDIGLIPLKDLPIFSGAIPSKIFDITSHKKPVLLGIRGEAKDLFIDKAKSGLFFEPENEFDLVEKINILSKDIRIRTIFGQNGYNFTKNEFNRSKVLENFFEFINK